MNRKKSNHALFLNLHLLAIVLVGVSLATGLRISLLKYAHFDFLSALLPQGQMHTVHYYSGLMLGVLCLSYVFYRKRFTHKTTDNKYHRIVNYLGYAVVVACIATGLLRWLDWAASWVTLTHYLFALLFIAFLLLHSYVYFLSLGKKLIGKLFQIKALKKQKLFLGCFVIFACFAIWTFEQYKSTNYRVVALNNSAFIAVDGKDDEAFWRQVNWHEINTYGGANFNNGHTPVKVKIASNDVESYFLFRWQDETKSLTHLPLVKLNQQWQVKQQGFHSFNETRYYEDKFAVLLSQSCDHGGDGTAHLGKSPIKGKPANWHGKGYHGALDGRVRDLWHWKALRTNDMVQMDDNVIAAPRSAKSGDRRYTAGYFADGKESGAYVMNWLWYGKDKVTPKRLPLPEYQQMYQGSDKDLEQAVMPWFSSTPYKSLLDTYPEGTLLSSVLYRSNRFEGDRGDVTAKGHWQDGFWTLEVARRNKTGSEYDVALEQGVCLWVAAFDHAQIAHTRHQRPLKLDYSALSHKGKL